MDVSRIPHPTENDLEKWNRYKQEYEQLMKKFEKQIVIANYFPIKKDAIFINDIQIEEFISIRLEAT